MTRRHRVDGGDGQGFIRWPSVATSAGAKTAGRRSAIPSDPGLVVDRRRLYNYLDSLESLSGE